jgi:hypothetical protein
VTGRAVRRPDAIGRTGIAGRSGHASARPQTRSASRPRPATRSRAPSRHLEPAVHPLLAQAESLRVSVTQSLMPIEVVARGSQLCARTRSADALA